MLVEIFEARASEETDSYIIRTKAENPGAVIRKISIFNAEAMKKHPDVVKSIQIQMDEEFNKAADINTPEGYREHRIKTDKLHDEFAPINLLILLNKRILLK